MRYHSEHGPTIMMRVLTGEIKWSVVGGTSVDNAECVAGPKQSSGLPASLAALALKAAGS